VFATVPFLALFDFLETRWMLVGAPALAGIAALVFVECLQWLQRLSGGLARLTQAAFAIVAVAAVMFAGHRLQASTEYGVDEAALDRSMSWIEANQPGRPVLVSWAHSDYHYLSFAYPKDPLYVATTNSFYSPATYIKDPAQWPVAMRGWYGPRFVGDYAALAALGTGPWLAIAWQRTPTSWNGLKYSWIPDDPHVSYRVVHRDGPYQVYLVEPRGGAGVE
jgi:hypothetical protein